MNLRKVPLKQYKYLTFLTMLFITIFIVCDITAFRMVSFLGTQVPLSGLIIPFVLAMADIIAEAYGYHITMRLIISGIVCQFIFGILITLMLKTPSPAGNIINQYYNLTFQHLIRTNITSCFSVTSSMFVNAFLISKLKIYMHGKRFWFRTIVSSGFSELVLCVVAYFILFFGLKTTPEILKIIYSVWIYRMLLTVPLAPICSLMGTFIKIKENTDVYDIGISYNPLSCNNNEITELDADAINDCNSFSKNVINNSLPLKSSNDDDFREMSM